MIELQDFKIQKYLTPYKYEEPVLCGSGIKGRFDECAVDIPFVFWHRDCFYMLYTGFDGRGYQSALATSKDLLHWTHKGVILRKREDTNRWDRIGGAATWMIKENNSLWEVPTLKKVEGKYWMVYHSYPSTGYEAGPAEISLAWSEDEELLLWNFLEEPVFSWKEGMKWEIGGLYKACLLQKENSWYLFYNAKDRKDRWIEQTGLAVSKDFYHWKRYEGNPVLKVNKESWDERFVSDPCIVRDGDIWLNFYFGYGNGHAQEGLALSTDLIHWEKVREPILTNGKEGAIDSVHAHKASVLFYKDVLYHFYCGTRPWQEGDPTSAHGEFRSICVAASKPFKE